MAPQGLTPFQMDGDAELELAVALRDDGAIQVFDNTAGTLAPHSLLPLAAPLQPYDVTADDFDGDGDDDLAASADSPGSDGPGVALDVVALSLGDGAGGFGSFANSPVGGSRPVSILAEDLDGDGDPDLATANELSDNYSVLYNSGTGALSAPVLTAVGQAPQTVVAIGPGELVTANQGSGDVTVSPVPGPPCPSGVSGGLAQLLLAVNGDDGDRFGFSVSISGDGNRILVGAPGDETTAPGAGSAYVFSLNTLTGSWNQTAQLLAADGVNGDAFGASVSISGDTALVGASSDDTAGVNQGSAYVFDFAASTWSETDQLFGVNGSGGDLFGTAVALQGDTAVIGAPFATALASNSGNAAVFTRNMVGDWIQTGFLFAADDTVSDLFGVSVALDGDVAVVGCPLSDDAGLSSGSAYVFELDGVTGIWMQTAKLTASDADAGDEFGTSVGISGDRILVGAPGWDGGTGSSPNTGAGYVFERLGMTWSEATRLTNFCSGVDHRMGSSVAISGRLAALGAPGDDSSGTDAGAVRFFEIELGGTSWIESGQFNAGTGGGELGGALDLCGARTVSGASRDGTSGANAGAAVVHSTQFTSFFADPPTISIAAGGTQTMLLGAPIEEAQRIYILAGSGSGTSPGFPLAPGKTLPLNFDSYLVFLLATPNPGFLPGSSAILNAEGMAMASLNVVGGVLPATTIGLTLNHAYMTLFIGPGIFDISFVSNPDEITLVP